MPLFAQGKIMGFPQGSTEHVGFLSYVPTVFMSLRPQLHDIGFDVCHYNFLYMEILFNYIILS